MKENHHITPVSMEFATNPRGSVPAIVHAILSARRSSVPPQDYINRKLAEHANRDCMQELALTLMSGYKIPVTEVRNFDTKRYLRSGARYLWSQRRAQGRVPDEAKGMFRYYWSEERQQSDVDDTEAYNRIVKNLAAQGLYSFVRKAPDVHLLDQQLLEGRMAVVRTGGPCENEADVALIHGITESETEAGYDYYLYLPSLGDPLADVQPPTYVQTTLIHADTFAECRWLTDEGILIV